MARRSEVRIVLDRPEVGVVVKVVVVVEVVAAGLLPLLDATIVATE